MSAEAALYALLAAEATVTAAVGSRIYPTIIPQEAPLPALVYVLTTKPPVGTIGAAPGLWRSTFAVVAVADSYAAAKGAASAARAALTRKSGSYGGSTVLSTQVLNESDAYDPETQKHLVQIDCALAHT